MAGIYIHIPFCRKACTYCNFHFSTQLKYADDMVKAILQEMALRAPAWREKKFNTLYFGGGTPSILNQAQLNLLMEQIREHCDLLPEAEISLEANPDDLQADNLSMLKDAGINRLSIGIQSFSDRHLHWMNRSHSAAQAFQCLTDASDAGFSNISTDVIYGYSGLTMEELEADIRQLIRAGVKHVSAYTMTIEPKTVLQYQLKKGRYLEPPDTTVEKQYGLICALLAEAGFDHYEVSNWAIPGFHSRHNSSYWAITFPYLGLGPAAHSLFGLKRSWNVANNMMYMNALARNELPNQSESLSIIEVYHDYVMTGLRTSRGIQYGMLEELTENRDWEKPFERLVKSGLLCKPDQHNQHPAAQFWRIPEEHWLMSDYIISELFIDDL